MDLKSEKAKKLTKVEVLREIKEYLQEQIDSIAEKIRTLDGFMPSELMEVVRSSHIPSFAIEGSADTLLSEVLADLEHLKGCYEELIRVAEDEGHDEIANYAQDRVLALAKHIWMIKSTLE